MTLLEKAESLIGKKGRLWDGKYYTLAKVRQQKSSPMVLAYFEEGAVCNIEIVLFEIDGKWQYLS